MSHDPNAVRSPQRRPVSEFRSVSTVSYSIRNVWGRMFCAGSFQSARQGDSCSTRGSPLGSRMGKRFASRFGGGALGQRAARLVGLPRVGGARGEGEIRPLCSRKVFRSEMRGECRKRCFETRFRRCQARVGFRRGRTGDLVAGLFVLCGRYRHPHVVPPSREGKVR